MPLPESDYARRNGTSLAYNVAGSGPDVLLVAGAAGTSSTWEDNVAGVFFQDLAAISRLTTYDQRGAGRSDPLADGPLPIEERVADLLAVADAAGCQAPYLLATHDGGPVALLAATAHPGRFSGLVLFNTAPRMAWAPDFPNGLADDIQRWFLDELQTRWGTGFTMELWAPSLAHEPDGRERWARLERAACSPAMAVAQARQAFATDARDLLPSVQLPTLIIQRRDDRSVPAGNGRYLADRIPRAELLELPGRDHMPYFGDNRSSVAVLSSFFSARRTVTRGLSDRRLAAVAVTDIVASTPALRALGDERWASVLDAHDAAARRVAADHGGRVVSTTGDGVLAEFAGPAQAIRFSRELIEEVARLGVAIRAGVHVGEVQVRGDDLAGLAVHAAARVAAEAGAAQILVSRTVVDLVDGSGLNFEHWGRSDLRGFDDEWDLYLAAG